MKCWEVYKCKKQGCPAYNAEDIRCWLFSGTYCRDEIQGKFLEKMEECLNCKVFQANIDTASMKETLNVINRQFEDFRRLVSSRDEELESIGMELTVGLSEVFEALRKISSGAPKLRISETSKIELISHLKHIVNTTAEEIDKFEEYSHEIAFGMAEVFDVLHKVSMGDLHARVLGSFKVELLESLKKVTNEMIESISRDILERKYAEDELRRYRDHLEILVDERTAELKKEIAERRHTEESLLESEERFRALSEYSRDVIMRFDSEHRHLYVNAVVEKQTGKPAKEFIGKTHKELGFPGHLCDLWGSAIQKVFDTGEMNRIEFELPNNIWIDWLLMPELAADGTVRYVITAARDISERKQDEVLLKKYRERLEELVTERTKDLQREISEHRQTEEQLKKSQRQLLQAQKMEAIGQLAGGVAHDFNNLLTAIIGYGNLLKMEIMNDSPLHSYIVQILNAADRAAHLTRDLLTFSRKKILQTNAVNLNQIIQSIQERLSRIIGEDIEFTTKLSDRELPIMADEVQIEQILMNLATNARDAMPNGGSMIIKTELVEVDNEFISIYGDFKPGVYAVIHFEDTGSGIEYSIKERIFEPFFSTKEIGKGSGLGLAIVYGIVKQHGGFINVYSEPKSGTTVKIYFPIIEAKIENKDLNDITSSPGGTETILIGEDDPQVRTLLKEILSKAGYDILEAKDGEDVLRVFKEAEDRVNLILLDVIMPKKNGKEVYDEIQKTRPDLKIIFISGYSAEVMIKRGMPEKGLVLLSKPISPHDLLIKIREMLD